MNHGKIYRTYRIGRATGSCQCGHGRHYPETVSEIDQADLFDEWRYLDHGEPGMDNSTRPVNPDFVLNQPRYEGASILLARKNFGCGSSREHAPWALQQYGFKAVIAPSFADIFFNNCFKNGFLPITLSAVEANPGYQLTVDLEKMIVRNDDASIAFTFAIDPFRQYCLMNGLDDIGLTLQKADKIREYEKRHIGEQPWLANTI